MNVALALREEILRVARRTVRAEVAALRKSLATQRKASIAMRKEIQALRSQIRNSTSRSAGAGSNGRSKASPDTRKLRFRAASLPVIRERLGLTLPQFCRLIGVKSDQTYYNYVSGKTRPSPEVLSAIAHARTLSKKSAAKELGL